MYAFQRVESLRALELIDLADVVDIRLILAENGDGACLIEGENKINTLAARRDAVAAKSDLGILEERDLAVVDDHLHLRRGHLLDLRKGRGYVRKCGKAPRGYQ